MADYDTGGGFKRIAQLHSVNGNLLQLSALTVGYLVLSGSLACDVGLVVRVSDLAASLTSHFLNYYFD